MTLTSSNEDNLIVPFSFQLRQQKSGKSLKEKLETLGEILGSQSARKDQSQG
jgi:hypothetical protein